MSLLSASAELLLASRFNSGYGADILPNLRSFPELHAVTFQKTVPFTDNAPMCRNPVKDVLGNIRRVKYF
jgi:hypothetical protein